MPALSSLAGLFLGAALAFLAVVDGVAPALNRYQRHIADTADGDLRAQFVDLPPRKLLLLALGLGASLGTAVALFLPWPIAVIAALGGLALPRVVVVIIRRRRQRAIIRQLPDALQALAGSLRAGTNIGRAMELVSRRYAPPLGEEFSLMLSRQRLGEDLESVLAAFVDRVPAEETALFRNAVLISHRVGGDLADTLETLASTLRERAQVEERIDALTAMGRMQGRVMCLLPVGIGAMLYLQQPEMMQRLFTDPIGWVVLAVISIMMGLAVISIRRLVAIDV